MASQESAEPIIDPDLPIVDAHHHVWLLPEVGLSAMESGNCIYGSAFAPIFRRHARYLFDELMADLKSGHNVRASVFVDAHAMYRAKGPEAMKSVGEVEFVSGLAAMAESGLFGEIRACAGIVGGVDLRLGDAVEEVLIAHIRAGGGRYRGVRSNMALYDEDSTILGTWNGIPHLYLDTEFRRGCRRLRQLDLSFDAILFEPQLPELIDLARAFPDTQFILDHVGLPLGVGRHAGRQQERFLIWRNNIKELSRCANVVVKLGGLGMPFGIFKSCMSNPPATSSQLAEEWKPYVDTCIESFGATRCMFESDFPVDAGAGAYAVVWNAFKRLAAGASKDERTALFSGTATRVYRLDL